MNLIKTSQDPINKLRKPWTESCMQGTGSKKPFILQRWEGAEEKGPADTQRLRGPSDDSVLEYLPVRHRNPHDLMSR